MLSQTDIISIHQPFGGERFRPQFHFTPRRNWMNDPNGLVYFDGEYHLFYQYNPFGLDWGHMSWGHAVSRDLVHWQELDVAIPETGQMIFSGSIIVDQENLSGLGDGQSPPLLAFYTAFHVARNVQAQHLAYSHDRGRTFIHYAANPIIDLDLADFRDPKVFYHDASKSWVMLLVLAREHVVQFYRSDNLLEWVLSGSFGPEGSVSGQWECPDLFELPVAGADDTSHWVMKMDVDDGLVSGGSGAQYFVGTFDGHRFEFDPAVGAEAGALVDLGPDFYAAVTWAGLPSTHAAPIWIGWQSNHQSGKVYPTNPWRGAMSLPRELFLFEEDQGLLLGQRPIAAIEGLRPKLSDSALDQCPNSGSFEQKLSISGNRDARVEVVARDDDDGALLTLAIDFAQGSLSFDRPCSPLSPTRNFPRSISTRLPRPDRVDMQIFVDNMLIEIFVDGGRRVYSACVFPQGSVSIEVKTCAGRATVESIDVWPMTRSIDFAA
jgi:fructan beta-fructosidase